jgi:phytoene dehydrogenase-like protein
VDEILLHSESKKSPAPKASGVRLTSGEELKADVVVSGCGPYSTFSELLKGESKEIVANNEELKEYTHHVEHLEHACGAFKINCAISELPRFKCLLSERIKGQSTPSSPLHDVGPEHRGTIHFEESVDEIELAYREALNGAPATKPVVEMTIPSSVDGTLVDVEKFNASGFAAENKKNIKKGYVAQLFIQFAPYDVDPKLGSWADPAFKKKFVDRVFSVIDDYCVNDFSQSVIGYDAISPLDLEREFALHKGNIFHGS